MRIDPYVSDALALLRGADADAPLPAVGDVATRRVNSRHLFGLLLASRLPVKSVDIEHYSLTTEDGATLALRRYRRAGSAQPGSAVLYLHGGGMILGLRELGPVYDSAVRGYVAASGVPMLLVDYRIAPENRHPAPAEDCYAALVWLAEHAGEFGADPSRLAVMGDSAGGGLSAAVCLMARDRGGPAIAQQVLVYPMLDDRVWVPDPQLCAVRDVDLRRQRHRLGSVARRTVLAARTSRPTPRPPGRRIFPVFPPPTSTWATSTSSATKTSHTRGDWPTLVIPTELHLHPGCPHAFDLLAPNAPVSQHAIADRVRRLQSL